MFSECIHSLTNSQTRPFYPTLTTEPTPTQLNVNSHKPLEKSKIHQLHEAIEVLDVFDDAIDLKCDSKELHSTKVQKQ